MQQKKLGTLAAAIAALVAMISMIAYLGMGSASADEPSENVPVDTTAPFVDEATLREALKTDRNKAFFWTGRVDGVSVEAEAARRAGEIGGATLETRLRDAGIEMPAFDNRSEEAVKVWTLASTLFAEQASGIVHVVMGTSLREGNVFESQEFPTLKNNPGVATVIKIDAATGERTTLFARPSEAETADDSENQTANDSEKVLESSGRRS
jgi:hypothetical protein